MSTLRAQSLHFPRRTRRRDLVVSLVICATVSLFWLHHNRFFDVQTFGAPIDYWGDALFTAGLVRACEVGTYVPFVSKLLTSHGAPSVASWNDFAITEDLNLCATGYLARAIGLFPAISVAWLGAALAAALSLYWVMRSLRVGWQWSALCAALFGLSPFFFHRTVHHFNLVFFWHVPWCVLACVWAASRYGVPFKSRRFWVGVGVAASAGFQNPYFFNFFLQILALSTLAGMLRHKGRPRAKASLTWLAVGVAAFLSMNLDTILYQVTQGPNPHAMGRAESDIERFALKPFELIFPQPPHVIPVVDRWANQHQNNTIIRSEHEYLGLFGAIAFLAMLALGTLSLLRRQVSQQADLALLAVWLMGYAIVGGLNSALGAIGVVLFRSSNRASIFIMALSFIVFAKLLTRVTRRWNPWAVAALAAVLFPLAAFEQVFPRRTEAEHAAMHAKAKGDQELVAVMQAKLPKGSRIFQLPFVDFPEVSFEPLRPFLWSEDFSYSFGNMRGRPEAAWSQRVAGLAPQQMLAELDQQGFKAIFVLGNGKPLADAFSAIRPVEFHASPTSGASVILLGN